LLLCLEQLWWAEQASHYIGMDGDHILLLGQSHIELKRFAGPVQS